MPKISEFYGIIIRINTNDHPPPHFHARYAEHEALIEIRSGNIHRGELPQRALRLVNEWCQLHRAELEENWNLAQAGRPLFDIEPL